MRGLRIFGGMAGCLLFSGMALFLSFACLLVVLWWLVINFLPFPAWQQQAAEWMFRGVVTRASVGFPSEGYEGPVGAVDGLPVPYPVTSHFGYAADYFGGTRYHTGVDMSCPVGTPVTNVMAGRVTFAGYDPSGYGNLVVVENRGVQVFYGHLSRVGVRVRETVEAGVAIGETGNTGWSTGPHLHWEVRVNGVPVDPLQVSLPGEGE